MNIISLTILLIASAVLSTAEQCGGTGTHVRLRVGDCDDVSNDECVLPTGVALTMAEEFVLSADAARVRIVAEVITPLGPYTVLTVNFDDLAGNQTYSISQDVILGPQLAGERGTFLVLVFNENGDSDYLEVCGVLPTVLVEG